MRRSDACLHCTPAVLASSEPGVRRSLLRSMLIHAPLAISDAVLIICAVA